jgi:hypothetical protein
MIRRPLAFAVVAALLAAGPAAAEDSDAAPNCDQNAKPVVSQGLPKRPCAAETGVVVRRGPEVVPEPSATAPKPEEDDGVRRVRVPRETSRSYRSSSSGVDLYPWWSRHPEPPRSGLVLRSGDVYVGINSGGYYPEYYPDRPYDRYRPDHPRRRHDDRGRGRDRDWGKDRDWGRDRDWSYDRDWGRGRNHNKGWGRSSF